MANNRVYQTGEYSLQNPGKYKGTKKPVFKSSFEHRVFYWCDMNLNVVEWAYEPFSIDYLFELEESAKQIEKDLTDGKQHKYYPDIVAKIKLDNGTTETFILEIKPFSQTIRPTEPKKKTKKSMNKYLNTLQEFLKNAKKWEYANLYAKQHSMKFQVLTERSIFK